MEQTERIRENKMGVAPMLPLIVSMSLPAMFSMLVQALYNIVDSYFVSLVSEDALAAVSLAFPIQSLLISLAVGTSIGLNSLVSRRLGEGNRKEADSAATHGLLLGVANWLIFLVVGVCFSGPFISSFTDVPAIAQMGTSYMSVVCTFSFGVFLEINVEKTLQATGNMIMPMVFQLTGALTNIILDPAFIFGFWVIPAMGVTGAAVATVIGQVLSMLVALAVLFLKKHEVRISFRGFRFRWKPIRDIYAVGVPSIIMQSIGSVMTMGMNAILLGFNTTAVAFFGIYFKVQSFVFMPVFGLTHGVMPIMGFNYGARKKKRLLSALKIGGLIALCIMTAGLILFWLFPAQILGIFNASGTMLEIGVPALRIISLCFPAAALGIITSTLFQAVGSGVSSLIISLLRQLIVLLPCAYLLAMASLEAVWYAFPIAEVFSLLASLLILWRIYKTRIRPMDSEAEAVSGSPAEKEMAV